ncbi:hypothetical protein D6D90_08610 [Moraxella catarrhalis]|nr:hypothetical protein [Moraxella catarrhalis]MPW81884.1 hypothetical protein [Moraxella catarrhalis]MPX05660.1 hypothetical protein [Moraxella catarrhalis]MPX36258.1 hypothetical protein [Moraxella catarrhalis]MPX48445.1 hypothetical protein [Moraxella catarrhalis]
MDAIRKAYYKHKDTLPAQPAQVKPKSKLAELVECRKAEKSAPQTTSQPSPTPKLPLLVKISMWLLVWPKCP